MNFIIFDLEATCWNGNSHGKVSEIIEIGAVKLNLFGEIIGEYNRFVKPILNPILSPFCKELTSIEQEQIDRAKNYETVIEEFQDWIGIFDDENYLLCSWGFYDRKMLVQDCKLHELEFEWAEEHINLKQQYKELQQLSKPWGLRKTVERNGFEFEGIHHRAISDAQNLSKVFVKYIDDWRY